jgi:hypothetical protein
MRMLFISTMGHVCIANEEQIDTNSPKGQETTIGSFLYIGKGNRHC